MILTSNRGFAEWGDVFGDPVVATALLDRLLHHAVVIQIEGSSYRLRQHADLDPGAPPLQSADHPTIPGSRHAAAADRRKLQQPRSTRRLITDTLPTRDFSSGTSRENSIGIDTRVDRYVIRAYQIRAATRRRVEPSMASGVDGTTAGAICFARGRGRLVSSQP